MLARPIFAATFLVACGTTAPLPPAAPAEPEAPAVDAFAALALVPADTPYAFAVLEPVPREALEAAIPEALRASAGAGALGDGGRLVIYGLGVYPAARMEIDDAEALRAMIEPAATERFELDGHEVLQVPLEAGGLSWIIAFPSDRELVGALAPDDEVEAFARALLGVDRPARSLADSGRLDAIAREHGLSRLGVGFVDTRRLLDAAPVALSAACAHDLEFLTTLLPEVALGYERFDERGMSAVIRLVTHPQVARALAALAQSVPGLTETPDGDPFAVVGLGVDLGGARALIDDAREALRIQPLRCAQLAPIGGAVAAIDDALARVPRALDVIHGAQVTIDELQIEPGPIQQVHVRARAAIAAADPELLLYQASPALNDGVAVVEASVAAPAELSLARVGIPGVDRVIVAVDDRAIALSAGADADAAADALPGILAGARPETPPLAVVAFDFARLMRLVGEGRTYGAMFDGFGLMTLALHADRRGVAVRMTAAFDRK